MDWHHNTESIQLNAKFNSKRLDQPENRILSDSVIEKNHSLLWNNAMLKSLWNLFFSIIQNDPGPKTICSQLFVS